jgi:hypothetical protein
VKHFKCQACGQLLYFENHACERCGYRQGYQPDASTLSALEPNGDTTWRALAQPESSYRFCANAEFDACNWLVPTTSDEAYCTRADTAASSLTRRSRPTWLPGV